MCFISLTDFSIKENKFLRGDVAVHRRPRGRLVRYVGDYESKNESDPHFYKGRQRLVP